MLSAVPESEISVLLLLPSSEQETPYSMLALSMV
jgi:hypothetical protein